MDIWCDFPNIQELAKAVGDTAYDLDSMQYWVRPYNFYDPKNTDWWLIPSQNWPAYPCGKGVFRKSDPNRRFVLCGLHVEKGYEPSDDWDYSATESVRLVD